MITWLQVDYDAYYARRPGRERWQGWRELGAHGKADHVLALLDEVGAHPEAVLDVGCGDGSVLSELARRRQWDRTTGVDVSQVAVELAQGQPGVTEVMRFDGASLPFADGEFPLVLASHVLEHVEVPGTLLSEMHRVSRRFALVEVPLERNLAARRKAARARSRSAGHVQRFNRRDIRRLMIDAGLMPVADLIDVLPRAVRVFQDGLVVGTVKWAGRAVLAAPPGLAERVMTVHYALLCTK
jgi:SAM-dependent methyltransferase